MTVIWVQHDILISLLQGGGKKYTIFLCVNAV